MTLDVFMTLPLRAYTIGKTRLPFGFRSLNTLSYRWNYTQNVTISFDDTSIKLLSQQDPEISFGGLTDGKSFNQVKFFLIFSRFDLNSYKSYYNCSSVF